MPNQNAAQLARRRDGPGTILAVAIVVLVVAAVLVQSTPARATHCPGETSADNFNWQDHYFVGWDHTLFCNQLSSFVVAIQRQNKVLLNWHPRSGVDGDYGPNTHLDVHDVQSIWGATSDGLVGPTSWSGYDNTLVWDRTVDGTEYWRFANYNAGYDTFKRFWPWAGGQICSIKVNGYTNTNWEDFSTAFGGQC